MIRYFMQRGQKDTDLVALTERQRNTVNIMQLPPIKRTKELRMKLTVELMQHLMQMPQQDSRVYVFSMHSDQISWKTQSLDGKQR